MYDFQVCCSKNNVSNKSKITNEKNSHIKLLIIPLTREKSCKNCKKKIPNNNKQNKYYTHIYILTRLCLNRIMYLESYILEIFAKILHFLRFYVFYFYCFLAQKYKLSVSIMSVVQVRLIRS